MKLENAVDVVGNTHLPNILLTCFDRMLKRQKLMKLVIDFTDIMYFDIMLQFCK